MTASQTEAATPRPWKVFTSPDGLKVVGIGSLEGEGVCDAGFGIWSWNDPEGIANAALIVRAVNNHGDMLEVLKLMADQYEQICKDHNVLGWPLAVRHAKAIISKAEGR